MAKKLGQQKTEIMENCYGEENTLQHKIKAHLQVMFKVRHYKYEDRDMDEK